MEVAKAKDDGGAMARGAPPNEKRAKEKEEKDHESDDRDDGEMTRGVASMEPLRGRRVVGVGCFRVLSLQLETQNEVDVLKPILEELEVLRLGCVLGALPTVNPKDFDFELLEAKEFDDEFARFLRSEVFGGGARENSDVPSVRVVGLFGKQPQVKGQLVNLGGWDNAMEANLQGSHLGLYAVVLPSSGDNGDTDTKTVVMFPWLTDGHFHASRLRETTAYLLRLLTSVTSHVTCCFSSEDMKLLEEFNLRDDDYGNGSDEEWRSYSAAFHVEQQQDAKDDVASVEVQALPLPKLGKTATKIDVIKGNFPALMAISKSPPIKVKKSAQRKTFSTPIDLCDWLFEQTNRFDLRLSVERWSDDLAETMVRHFGEWPQKELEDVEVSFELQKVVAERRLREKLRNEIDDILAELERAGDKMFQLDALVNEGSIADEIACVKDRVQHLKTSESAKPSFETVKILHLPARLPKMVKRFRELFENKHEDLLNEALSTAPVTLARDMVANPENLSVSGIFKSIITIVVGDSSDISERFRERMREPLQTMKQVWWAEFSSAYKNFENAKASMLLDHQLSELQSAKASDFTATINRAYNKLLFQLSESSLNGLCVHISIHYRLGHIINCSYQEEECLPTRNQLQMWSLKLPAADATRRELIPLGEVDLHNGENLLGVFTIQTRSALIVVVSNGHTIVRRVDFGRNSSNLRYGQMPHIREIQRPSILCDYYSKERLLVLVDSAGKAGVYRLDEKFNSMETIRTLNLALTSLTMPVKDLVLSDGVLYMVDHDGAMQALNTRNQQTSRKKQVGFPETQARNKTRLVRVLGGSILGWIDTDVGESVKQLKFIASEDMRDLPQSTTTRVSENGSDFVYEVMDDILFVVDLIRRCVRVVKLEASLKSESYRIRSVNGIRTGDAMVNGTETDEKTALKLLSYHWLWTFYHLYEKFPVRGELFRTATGASRRVLELSFVCDIERTSTNTDFDDGCQKLLALITEKLQLLNKPLYGLDLAGVQVSIGCGAAAQSSMKDDYERLDPHSVASLLRELVTFVPLQICRAEFNSLTLMNDGQYKPHQESDGSHNDGKSLSSADIALKLRFGLLSPLLSSWNRQCIVVTSMGKQSTGKSYFLNHLTGSSFAISGARCTDGAWMSVRFLPNGMMLVVIDFEGLGSFERTEQEDVFLSVLNASVSMLTIFRMEMRLDKEIDELFSKFQKGSQLIKSDPQLFRGKLYMSVKDVNPNDQRGVVGEFVAKFQRLLEANKEQNFLTDMYAGQLDINCSPPLGTTGYYRSLSHAQKFIDKQLCGNPKAGFTSGKAFLDCIRLLLAKVSILDWTSLDESSLRMKLAEMTQKLPSVLRYGAVCDMTGDETTKSSSSAAMARERLANPATGTTITVTRDDVCAANPTLASRWNSINGVLLALDQVSDDAIDLGAGVSLIAANRSHGASSVVQDLFKLFIQLVENMTSDNEVTRRFSRRQQHDFDSFLSFVIRRRGLRIQMWSRSVFGNRVPEAWITTERQAISALETLFVRCLDSCSKCQLGCMKVSIHVAGGNQSHDCGTNHACTGLCGYCADVEDGEETPACSKPAGHEGRCECDKGDHTCGKPCLLDRAMNCGKFCSKKAGHDESEDHKCSVGLHKCGQVCAAHNCPRPCVMDVEVPHTAHKCEVDRCLSRCIMEGCNRNCSSTDHFHGQTEAKIAFDVENPDLAEKYGGTFDASDEKPTIHMCEEGHSCPDMCSQEGICHIDVILKQSSKTFVGARGSFQYTFQEMNGTRKKCAHKLAPGQTAHTGPHTCVALSHHGDGDEETKFSEVSDQVIHYCNERCPSCSYYCQREHGHEGLHKTSHGNMRNTMFISEENEIDLIDRKYTAGERGTAEMCNLFCSKMGRSHVHFLNCEKESPTEPCVYQGSREDMRRHCTLQLEPPPEREQDELLHERFWDTLGWEDPCTSLQEREEFGKCAYHCDAPDHEEHEVSYCVLPAWHPPVAEPTEGPDGFSYVSGHKFECSHVSSGNAMHHIFVLDASGSMQGAPWQRLNGAFREYLHNRVNGGSTLDLVTVITFDGKAEIVWEAEPITSMTDKEAPFLGGGTSFSAGLRAANEVLSRMAFESHKPVIVFFSDGYPAEGHEGDGLANHIADSYAKYGLEAFAVGFGYLNLAVLERVVGKLGGTYCHVLTGDELKKTFHTISASLGTRAGLALTKPFHEMVCVICQKELASEATTVLTPCQHELHQSCLRRLVESTAEGTAMLCPTCRRELDAPAA